MFLPFLMFLQTPQNNKPKNYGFKYMIWLETFKNKNPFSLSIMPRQSLIFSQNHNCKFFFENLTSNQPKTQKFGTIPQNTKSQPKIGRKNAQQVTKCK
jgi:hypothetical protein